MMNMKDEFLDKIALSNTLGACMQRGKVYIKNIKQKERDAFTNYLLYELKKLTNSYKSPVTPDEHCRNIIEFSNLISQTKSNILNNGRFRIGTAQKAINVYLKFLWCLNQIPEPPHCPIDGIVLNKLKNGAKWTKLDNIDEYKKIIAEIERVKGARSISEWECALWNTEA